jgi:hypothetical protein
MGAAIAEYVSTDRREALPLQPVPMKPLPFYKLAARVSGRDYRVVPDAGWRGGVSGWWGTGDESVRKTPRAASGRLGRRQHFDNRFAAFLFRRD